MASELSVTMKLLVDTQSNRVLFAEASKDCVDFLFHMLSLPIATVISILQEDEMVGSVQNLYSSIENLHESYILQHHTKDSLLKPNSKACACSVPMLQINDVATPPEKKFYRCNYCSPANYPRVSDSPEATCPNCSHKMITLIAYVSPPAAVGKSDANEGGFVKGVVTYMVMDDLTVTPMSTISCISLLNRFNVRDVSALQEKTVNLGYNEVSLLTCVCFAYL